MFDWRLCILGMMAMVGTGCASVGFTYVAPKSKAPTLQSDELEVSVTRVVNPWGNCLGLDVVVRNVSDHVVVFDPDDVVLKVPAGARAYKHVNKMDSEVSHQNMLSPGIWDMPNVAFKNPIGPREKIAAVLWYEVPYEKIHVDAVSVDFHKKSVRLPEGGGR